MRAQVNVAANDLGTIVVEGSGEANSLQPELFEARTRATVRYADPAAWITAAAIAYAIAGARDLLAPSLHEVGVVVISDQGPASTMTEVNAATLNGFSSPMRYAASSPGSLAGVACIAFGFRGPTINFTMMQDVGVPIGLQLCAGWLTRSVAQYMVLATFCGDDLKTGISRAVLLTLPDRSRGFGSPLTPGISDWLMQIGRVFSPADDDVFGEGVADQSLSRQALRAHSGGPTHRITREGWGTHVQNRIQNQNRHDGGDIGD